MTKVTLATQIDKRLLDDAQRLVDAGEFDSLRDLVAEALAALLRRYEMADAAAAHQQMAARQIRGLKVELDTLELEQFEKFVEAYTTLTKQPPSDEDMVNLLNMFKFYHSQRMFEALHEAQDSQVPLSTPYLETILERLTAQGSEHKVSAIATINRALPRVYNDFDNPFVAEVAKMYEKEIGELTEKIKEKLTSLVEEYPDLEQWHEAIEAAGTMNKRSLAYVIGCLRGNGQKPEPKGTKKRGVSKSEQHRTDKRRQIKDDEDYWDKKLKAKLQGHKAQ